MERTADAGKVEGSGAHLELEALEESYTAQDRPVLAAIGTLLDGLEQQGIRYCHWKSNYRLDRALSGEDDLDLLVDRRDAAAFQAVLADCGFRRVTDTVKPAHPSIEQYFAVDPATLNLFHIDAYYRIITGETLAKEYHLPLETMLLEERRTQGIIPVPSPAADLLTLVIRTMIKLDAPTGLVPAARRSLLRSARQEITSLWGPGRLEEIRSLLAKHLPALDPDLWEGCLDVLRDGGPPFRTWLAARALKRRISGYRRLGPIPGVALGLDIAMRTLIHRLRRSGRTKHLATGGAVVAFVGPEATGKSTLARGMVDWLGTVFEAQAVHLGKPPSTWLTAVPNLALPYLRRVARGHRTDSIESDGPAEGRSASPLFAARCLMLAWDRYALARKAHRLAANGCLVFCDRYPSDQTGAVDSARMSLQEGGWRGLAASLEQWLYRRVPQPDLVLELTVPPEVAVERNRSRIKPGKESDERVRARHAFGRVPVFHTRTIRLDTEARLEQTLREAKAIVWREL